MTRREDVDDKELATLRKRVESWRDSFPTKPATTPARRPLVVEVCGTPKAGKSTLIQYVAHLFRRCGLRIAVIPERAELNPLPEKIDPSFNAWNLTSVIGELLTATQADYHIVLVDRGLLDCNAWLTWHHKRTFVSKEELATVTRFTRCARWWNLLDLVVAAIVPAPVALLREPFGTRMRSQSVTQGGGVPKVMEKDVLEQYNCALECVLAGLGKPESRPPIWRLDMTRTPLDSAAMESAAFQTAQRILSVAESTVPEDILVLPRGAVSPALFRPGFRATDETVEAFVRAVDSKSLLVPRPTAEEEPLKYVQPIALAVVRHADKILLLRRKEADQQSYMHEKYVVCAGGHLRRDDRSGAAGTTVEGGLHRELKEELQLAEVEDIRLLGLVYDTDLTRYLGHIGVIYEVRLAKEEAALARSGTKEFKERAGTSVSCTFVSVKELEGRYANMDEWSKHLVSALFGIRKEDRAKQAVLF